MELRMAEEVKMNPLEHNESSTIGDYFSGIPDPRDERKTQHKLVEIITIAICAVICGADGWTDVERFGKARYNWLKGFLELEHGIPSHDTFGRVFSLISPTAFENCFRLWVQSVSEKLDNEIVAIDGKTLRHSYDRSLDKAALHMVSAWASKNALVLGQVKTDEKSNEITAIPKLLELLDLNGCIVTIDAMGCQKEIAEDIINCGGDYVLTLKDNQKKLRSDVGSYFQDAKQNNFENIEFDYHETFDDGHGRIENRYYWIAQDVDWLTQKDDWKGLKTIGMVKAERCCGDKTTTEKRFFISSLESDAKLFAKAVRTHWEIENKVHWILDVAFREDDSRVRKDHAPQNLTVLRRIAINLFKKEKTRKGATRAKRLQAAWDNEYLEILMSKIA